MSALAPYRKAIAAFLTVFATALLPQLDDGVVTLQKVLVALVAAVAGGGLTYAVPNTPVEEADPAEVARILRARADELDGGF